MDCALFYETATGEDVQLKAAVGKGAATGPLLLISGHQLLGDGSK
jgi:hypothetical protein